MKILITGAFGFLGKNLAQILRTKNHEILEFDLGTPEVNLLKMVEETDFIVHLAGVNRPITKDEFFKGNVDFTTKLINIIKMIGNPCPILFSSSIQASLDNEYGQSKKIAEDFLFDFQKQCGNKTYVYRLSNLFGKWSKPNYNSVVATFCNNIAHDLPIQISNPLNEVSLVYIDDVVDEFVSVIEGRKQIDSTKTHEVNPIYPVPLGKLADLIQGFKKMRVSLSLPKTSDSFERKLYATYLSYLDPQDFAYSLVMKKDIRGSFTEFIRTEHYGQVSVNISKPGVTKGNHFHFTKNEKFLVVSGKAEIKFRGIYSKEVISFAVDSDKFVVVDVPPGYTHSITNIGNNDLVTIIWASEPFDPNKPDTYFMEV